MSKNEYKVTIDPEGDVIFLRGVALNDRHTVKVTVDTNNRDVYLDFSSRESLHDFGLSLVHEAVFGRDGQKEFYPLREEGGSALIVDGARLTDDSSRVFVFYPSEEKFAG